MRSQPGLSVDWEIQKVSVQLAEKITNKAKKGNWFSCVRQIIPEEKLHSYFAKQVYFEISPVIRLIYIAIWHEEHRSKGERHIVLCPEIGITFVLQAELKKKNISLDSYRSFLNTQYLRQHVKLLFRKGTNLANRFRITPSLKGAEDLPTIAVHCVFGVDARGLSELYWYENGIVDPNRILIYFDSIYRTHVSEEIIKQIEEKGMRWVCLSKGLLPRKFRVWQPSRIAKLPVNFTKSGHIKDKKELHFEQWISQKGRLLIHDVEYWMAFFKAFNVRIHHESDLFSSDIPKCIAIGILNGVQIGKQRSDFKMNELLPVIRYTCHHIFFTWNRRINCYAKYFKSIESFLVSGFPHDKFEQKAVQESTKLRTQLCNNGSKFTVALFDNAFNRDTPFTSDMMELFYSKFINWAIEDKEVGIIIKSKKPHILQSLPEAEKLLRDKRLDGRCIVIPDYSWFLCTHAANAADFSVGIGIASAVSEAVIAGCRGVHCDLAKQNLHIYYEWGYGKLIYDDIDHLISDMRKYREDPSAMHDLGNWSEHINELDPFRDGKSGARIGAYTRWLLEGFDEGKSRDKAIEYANRLYGQSWGEDKVVVMKVRGNTHDIPHTGL
ncbi:MAG: hypothetical protein JRI85_14645 [Deltaproteobacteria bacterium]|nr:hypothetical protein [Deltaproteobacteria bacterium]